MFGQKLPIRTTRHTFLESRQPEAPKKPHYILSSEWSQKRGISSWATKLHKSRDIWEYFSRFRYIQDSDITGSDNVNQHLRVKSDSSFKSLFKSIWNIFSFLFQKWTFNIFFYPYMPCMQARHSHHPHWHTPSTNNTPFSSSLNYSRT